MEKTHTLESGDDLFHKPISNDMFEKQSYGNAGLALPTSCLETPSGLIWISCTISVRPWPNRQIAKFGWESIRTITNDLSVTVPFSPAIVLGPSSKTGALVAVSHPYSFQPSRLFKRQGTRRTLVEGVTSDGGTEGKSANDVGPGRTGGDGGECAGCTQG